MRRLYDLIMYDIKKEKRGIIRVLILFFLFALLAAAYTTGNIRSIEQKDMSFSELIICLFGGMKPLKEGDNLKIPTIYLGEAIMYTYSVGIVMSSGFNHNVIVRLSSKKLWLFEKNILSSLLIVCGYISVTVISVLFGCDDSGVSEKIVRKVTGCEFCTLNTSDVWLMIAVVIIVPLVTSIAIANVQIVVSILTNGIAGFIVSIAIYILSLFSTDMLWIANGCMVQRSSYFMSGGYNPLWMCALSVLVIVVSLACQIILVKRKEFWD